MVGSPYPIDNGASTRTLHRRVAYGGKKGRAAKKRLRALERRLVPVADALFAEFWNNVSGHLAFLYRIGWGLFPRAEKRRSGG